MRFTKKRKERVRSSAFLFVLLKFCEDHGVARYVSVPVFSKCVEVQSVICERRPGICGEKFRCRLRSQRHKKPRKCGGGSGESVFFFAYSVNA